MDIKDKFDKDFWTKKRPHVEKKENDEDMIPFKWSKNTIKGNVILKSFKNNN